MNIRELAAAANTTERQIRYLIAEGFVPSPRGGRAHADYGPDHLEAIGRFTRLRDLGFPPAAIHLLLQAGTGVPFAVANGVTLVIAPDLIASGAPQAPLIDAVQRILARALTKEHLDADPSAAD